MPDTHPADSRALAARAARPLLVFEASPGFLLPEHFPMPLLGE